MAKRRGKRGNGGADRRPAPPRDPDAPRRAVGYVRVSTDDQADFGESLALQRDQVALFCRLYNLELVAVEEDPGLTASNMNRPGLRAALARLESGEAVALVVMKLDRLARDVADVGSLVKKYFLAESMGCQLMSVEEKVDTSSAGGIMVLNVIMTMAQWERQTIVERVRGALRFRKANGQRTGGLPYGYELDPDGKTNKPGNPVVLRPNPHEIAGLVVLAALRESGGSFRGIAARLDGLGYKPRGGSNRFTERGPDGKPAERRWSFSSVDKILRRPEFAETDERSVAAFIYKATEGRPGLDFDALMTLYRSFSAKGVALAGQTEGE